jgi:uncharacterized protein YcfJ
MNKILAAAVASTVCLAASAVHAQSFSDNARVVSVRAITERVPISREQCWNERQRGYEERRVTRTDTGASIGAGTVLGAIAGGVIGHQFGNSSGGRDRGTAAGAIVGGLVGNQVDRDNAGPSAPPVTETERRPVERDVERCRTVEEVREMPVGYDVRYEYRGRQFNTRLPQDPGPMLRVRVDVAPEVVAPPPPPPGPYAPSYR